MPLARLHVHAGELQILYLGKVDDWQRVCSIPTYVYLRWEPFVSRSCSVFRELLEDSLFAANYYNDDHTTAGLHLDQCEFALELSSGARLAHKSVVRRHRRLCSRHHLGGLPSVFNLKYCTR